MAHPLQLTGCQTIKFNFPRAKLAKCVLLTRFVNCLQNLNIARTEHAGRNTEFAKTSWERKYVSVKMATRANFLAVQVISTGNRTGWSPIRAYYLLIINDSFEDLREDKKAGERRKLFYEFVREKADLAVSVREHIAFLLFSFQ